MTQFGVTVTDPHINIYFLEQCLLKKPPQTRHNRRGLRPCLDPVGVRKIIRGGSMKRLSVSGILFVVFCSALAQAKAPKRLPVHLDLEATSAMYEAALDRSPIFSKMSEGQAPEEFPVEHIINVGKRNLDWLIFINEHRDVPLTFTVPGSLTGIPITAPKKYSGKLVNEQYTKFMAELPAEMRDVLVGGKEFTENPPIAVEQYLKLGNEVDKLYQTATRWKLMQPYLQEYAENRQNDIRGFYFLRDVKDLSTKLANWETVSGEEKTNLTTWLVGQCFNTVANETQCRTELSIYEDNKDVQTYYKKYLPKSSDIFSSFFKIQNPRPDLVWGADNVAVIPFKNPGVEAILNFLAVNIEDEWKWNDWKLKLDFLPEADIHVDFEEGVTPHVNELGGNSIVMDANSPLTEWDVQWTIRHEFGHVLGIPDCYVEFFDADEKVMINYQIDVDNLMCSRRGKMNDVIFQEMKRNYSRD